MWAFYKLKLSSRTRKYRTCGYLKKNFKLQKILISCFFRPLFQKNKKNKKKKPQSIPEPQRGNCWYKTLLTPGLERIRHEDVKSTSMYKCVFFEWTMIPKAIAHCLLSIQGHCGNKKNNHFICVSSKVNLCSISALSYWMVQTANHKTTLGHSFGF